MTIGSTINRPLVILRHGIGNKLNHIMNTLCCKDVEYIWVNGHECMANHDDLFDWRKTKLNITSIHQKDLGELLENRNEFLLKGFFWFQGMKDSRLGLARDFLKKIKPSKQVKDCFNYRKKYKKGFAVRLFHPQSIKDKTPLIIPYDSFLTSDCRFQYEANPWAFTNNSFGGNSDLDHRLRKRGGQIMAATDWFSLLNCNKVFTYGTHPKHDRPLGVSTFTDAVFISGKYCRNITL